MTGASAGVGRATAQAFAQRGAARGPHRPRAASGSRRRRREVEALGGRAAFVSADVADAAQVDAAADELERQLGPIDVWVNNAMATVFAPVGDTTPDEFRRATEVTYLGSVWGTMAALRLMRRETAA